MENTPSASYSLTLRVKLASRSGTLGELTTAIGRAGGDNGAIDIVRVGGGTVIRDLKVSKDPDEIVRTVKNIATAFGGINLEDISAPRCFEIEDRLKEELNIPVFHDDQHGTAVVVLAALINALKITGKRMEDIKVVVNGIGAAGVACSKIVMSAGVKNIIGCDTTGAIYEGRSENMNWVKDWYARNTNPGKEQGTIHDIIKGADVFFGLSVPGVIDENDLKNMAKDPIVFAMANPIP